MLRLDTSFSSFYQCKHLPEFQNFGFVLDASGQSLDELLLYFLIFQFYHDPPSSAIFLSGCFEDIF